METTQLNWIQKLQLKSAMKTIRRIIIKQKNETTEIREKLYNTILAFDEFLELTDNGKPITKEILLTYSFDELQGLANECLKQGAKLVK